MSDIRINQLPLATGPTSPMQSDFVPIDGTNTRKATLLSLADVINPPASQAEAEGGTNPVKRMTPLTTAQAIQVQALTPSDVGSTAGTVAAGDDARIVNSLQGIDASRFGLLPSNTASQNSVALDAIEALSGNLPIYVPQGVYDTTKGFYDLINKRYFGPGRIKLGGYAQAPNRKFFTSPQPNASTDRVQIFDALGDVHYPSYTFVGNGVNETPPPTVYTNYFQYCGRVHIHDLSGGFNTPTDDHVQRSGHFGSADFFYHGGLGDGVLRTSFGTVSNTKPGLTHWLAGSAIVGDNGGYGADPGAGVVYLNREEKILTDGNNPATGIFSVANLFRNNSTTTQSQVWAAHRIQSSGSAAINVSYSPSGPFDTLFSSIAASLGANGAAITLARDHYIYFGCTPAPDSKGILFNANLSAIKLGYNLSTQRLELNGQDLTTTSKSLLALSGSWSSTVSEFGAVKYRKHAGRVYIDGQAKGGSNFTIVGTLPSGFRPAVKRSFSTISPFGRTAVQIWPDGSIVAQEVANDGSANNVSLDGIQFDLEA